jgi:hypothetical protein
MKTAKGYYCIVQFTPDQALGEAANVGVLLFSPEHGFLDVELSSSNHRVRRFFGPDRELDLERIRALKASLKRRLRVDAGRFQSLEDLRHFVETRANQIILTPPRPITVTDPRQDLTSLFQELVGGHAQRPADTAHFPALEAVMNRPGVAAKVERHLQVLVPVIDRPLAVPYAYRNGTFNLLYPKRFPEQRNAATRQACQLAAEGHLIARHKDPERGQMRLVVIPEYAGPVNGLVAVIEQVFSEHDVRVVPPQGMEALAEEIEREGHRVGVREVNDRDGR